jgi:DNA-binding XRE family transcriptional regulator
LRITRPELAVMVGISEQTVDLFERNYPVPLDSRRRILKELWSQKNKK